MAPILDFMRDLREQIGTAVAFVHHTGHEHKNRMRGSSDLEGYWESKLSLKRGKDGVCTVAAEHREAEAMADLHYHLNWHEGSRSMLLQPLDQKTARDRDDELLAYVANNPHSTIEEVAAGLERQRDATSRRLRALEGRPSDHGTLRRVEIRRKDKRGRSQPVQVWCLDPLEHTHDAPSEGRDGASQEVPSREADGAGRRTSAEPKKPHDQAEDRL